MKTIGIRSLAISTILGGLILAFTETVLATSATTDFRNAVRKLWEDHVTWTRLYIVSAVAELPDKDATARRLLQNQADIGNAIKSFYGDAAGDKLTALLKDHILIAAEVIEGAKAGDTDRKDGATKRWYANADDIASFLTGANPRNWPLAEMRSMMHEHLDVTTGEVVARLKKDWTADISAYEKVHEQILKMADMLSSGIIEQFPARFSK
ncbi:MAG TPA: hypothetical protein VFA77_08955 [Candidatus Eisenbacteria bacterium]|nr:hypothetical protein [Candidatus Eisenbacteria bacterium]